MQTELTAAWSRLSRPALGFERPDDVLKDADLPPTEKRAILSSWASDACAVEGRPYLRAMPGADHAVPLLEVQEALRRLDRWD